MKTVAQAEFIIRKAIVKGKTLTVKFNDAYGYTLAESIKADRNYPAADKSMMDGIAISFKDYKKGTRPFKLEGVIAAGSKPKSLSKVNSAIEIMTGAILPSNADVVIPVENLKIKNGSASVDKKYSVKLGDYIQKKASHNKKGDVLLTKGQKLLAPQIAIAATVGKSTLKVIASPRVAIVTTGDELINVNKMPKNHQIRKSNSYFIDHAISQNTTAKTKVFHFKDNKRTITDGIKKILKEFDLLVLTGGVSMGKFDFVPEALKQNKVKELFHKVTQKPGKPIWVGQTTKGQMVFGLPGNPVSTMCCTYKYVIPAIQQICGGAQSQFEVKLNKQIQKKTEFTFYQPVRMLKDGLFTPVNFKHSSDVLALAKSDGFIEIPAGVKRTKLNQDYKYYAWS